MDEPHHTPDIEITAQLYGKSGGAIVTIRPPGGEPFTDKVMIADAAKRAEFVERIMARYGGLDRAEVEVRLEEVAASSLAKPSGGSGGGDEDSQATMLVAMVASDEGVELFHSGGGYDAAAYAVITVGGHRETWPLKSMAFRQWLSQEFYKSQGKVPGGQALADAINTLVGKAVFEGDEHEVHIRAAEHDGEIWLDLGDKGWRAVRVTKKGWTLVEQDIPVRFVRRRAMLPLPVPRPKGSVTEFRELVNLPEEDQWMLALAWLVAAFRPNRPFTLLNVTGEQGCAKSTLCKMLRSMIDPAKPLLRRPPKDDRDLMIASGNSWVVGYDNISSISNSLSDSLCSLATGGGFATRQLYTDDEEKIFDATRPVIVNGITDAVTRPDLLDRSINLHLGVIPKEKRRDEDELWAEFYRLQPRILGSILTILSTALQNLPTTRLAVKPRMADFALMVTAAEPALPWAPGKFLEAYTGNREASDLLAVEASPIGPAIMAMMSTVGRWVGTATNLLKDLSGRADEHSKSRKDWPGTPRGLGGELRRIAPNLRALGIGVILSEKPSGHDKRMLITLEKGGKGHSAPPAPSADVEEPPWPTPPAGDAEDAGGRFPDCSDGQDDPEIPV